MLAVRSLNAIKATGSWTRRSGGKTRNSRPTCDNLLSDRSQIVDSKCGEMSEWLKEHAWKLVPLARADAHQIASTQFPSTTSRNINVPRCVPVNSGVAPGFRGVCDTVLTQDSTALRTMRIGVRSYASRDSQSNASDVEKSRFASICLYHQIGDLLSPVTMASTSAMKRRGGLLAKGLSRFPDSARKVHARLDAAP
jgi:hypothetical protein